jgi:hypothetical protein
MPDGIALFAYDGCLQDPCVSELGGNVAVVCLQREATSVGLDAADEMRGGRLQLGHHVFQGILVKLQKQLAYNVHAKRMIISSSPLCSLL